MQKIFKKISSVLIAIVMCFGITVAVHEVSSNAIVADAATDYYSSITATEGTSLLGQLHDLITTTHNRYTSYEDCKNPTYVKQTDPGSNSSSVKEFYSQADIASTWGSGAVGTWNREHVWCQSLSNNLWGETGGGADMHHIRPAESQVNSTRGNNKFGKATGGKEVKYAAKNALAGYCIANTVFEPIDSVKGDVARIVMYVYTHYNNYYNVGGTTNGTGGKFGTLNFTHVMYANSENDAKKMLLEWNKLDPVDDSEIIRNDVVYGIQGNRNPFIDHPEYADYIWGDGSSTPGGDTTLTGLSLSPSTLNLTVGQTGALTVSATPSNASKSVTWSTSNESVATVTGSVVTAKAAGTATITATSTTNSNIKATATVTVTEASSKPNPSGSTVTIDISKFASLSGYSFHKWTDGGVSGIAFIYGTENQMQFNSKQSTHYLASTTPTSGSIKSVTAKLKSDTKSWQLLTSNTAYAEINGGNPTTGTDQGTKTVNTSETTWTVSGNDTYFALVYKGSGVCYLDSVVVTYESNGGAGGEEHICEHVCDTCHKCTDKACADPVCNEKCAGHGGEQQKHICGHVCDTCHKCTDKACADPVCSEKCTGHGGEQQPGGDNAKLQAFHKAVEDIISEGSLAQRLESINQAIIAYRALSAADKALAAEDIAALQAAIDAYNQTVRAYNEEFKSANHSANGGAR